MTVLTDTQVVTASGGLVELGYAQTTAATTIGTSTTSLIPTSGNLTVVCDGSPVLVEVSIPYVTAPTSSNTRIQLVVDGVTNNLGIFSPNTFVPGQFKYRLTPSAGSHTFSVVGYSDVAGTMGAGAATGGGAYVPAFLRVSKIVTATQWPAVTTGTIICTSSTRPASPFAGQRIYETDTSREHRWNGSAWVCMTDVGMYSNTSASTTSTSYVTTLTGDTTPVSVSVNTGTNAKLDFGWIGNINAVAQGIVSFSVSGATTVAAADSNGTYMGANATNLTSHRSFVFTGLTAGVNTFTLNYKAASAGTLSFISRWLTARGVN